MQHLPVLTRVLAVSACALGLTLSASAQIRAPGAPRLAHETRQLPTVLLEAPDVAALQAEDTYNEANAIPGPLRFGVPLDVAIAVHDLAAWEPSDDGEQLVARLRITAPGAHSLGLDFGSFVLPDDGQLFLYDDTGRTQLGAYTSFNAGPDGAFVIEPFAGESVIVEYSQPATRAPEVELVLQKVVYDYRDVFALERQLNEANNGGGYSGGCSVGVNCPEGDPFELQKRCTVRTVSNGGLCSGVIMNNTAEDETPYLYTAQHCGQTSSVVVRFNYQRPNCNSGSAPTNQQMSGATVLDGDTDTDGRLLRLNNNIPDNYNVYYSGWSRSTSNLTFGMSMHHPGGSPKEISIDSNGGGQTTAGFIGIGNVKVWNINFQIGGTAGGSSGGPLFDQNNRVRGVLTGGPGGNCSQNYYGRFHNFWLDDNLEDHLDPQGTGQTNLNGFDPFADLSAANLGSLSVTNGPAGGFTQTTLSGSGFDAVSAVTFGGVNALDYTVVNNSTITATVPAGPVGFVDVAVTDTFGTSTLNNGFLYSANPAPSVDTITPDQGDIAGGTVVTITGSNVLGVTSVEFDGVPGTGLTIVSPTELTVDTPAASSGPVDVLLTGNGSDLLADGFTFVNPGGFINVGFGLAGQFGIVPFLQVSGDFVPGGAGFSILTLGLVPNAFGAMFLSLGEAALPFKGGTLYTFPIVATIDLQASAIGQVPLGPLPLDPAIPGGTQFWLQQVFVDAAAVQGLSMTAAVRVTVGDI